MTDSQIISSFIKKISNYFNKLTLKDIDQNYACAYFYEDSLVFGDIKFCIGTHLAIIFDKVNKIYKKGHKILYKNPSRFMYLEKDTKCFSWHDGILESCKFLNIEPYQLYMLFHACGTPFNPFTKISWKKQPKEILENMKLIDSFPPKMNIGLDYIADMYPSNYIECYDKKDEYYVRQICIFEKLFSDIEEYFDIFNIEKIILNIKEIEEWLLKTKNVTIL